MQEQNNADKEGKKETQRKKENVSRLSVFS